MSGHPVSIVVEGIQVTLPSYEEAVSNNSASASAPSNESRVQIVLSEGYPQTTGPEAGPSQPSSLSQLHSEMASMDPSPPSSFSSPSSGTLQHAGAAALPHDDQRGLPLLDSEVDCSDGEDFFSYTLLIFNSWHVHTCNKGWNDYDFFQLKSENFLRSTIP